MPASLRRSEYRRSGKGRSVVLIALLFVAAAVLVFIPELLRFLPPVAGVDLAQHKQLLYALLLIVLIRLAPNGLLGLHEGSPILSRLLGRRPAP